MYPSPRQHRLVDTPLERPKGSTFWGKVRRALKEGVRRPPTACRELVLHYAPAIRKYIDSVLRHPQDADVLAEEVIAQLMRGDFAGADPDRERFRDVVVAAIRSILSQQDKNRTTFASDEEWLRAWQTTVLDHVWTTLKSAEDVKQELPAYTVLKVRTLHPEDSREELATRLSAITGSPVRADSYRQMLRRSRMKFAEALVAEIRMGLDDPSDDQIHTELAVLRLLEYVQDILPLSSAFRQS